MDRFIVLPALGMNIVLTSFKIQYGQIYSTKGTWVQNAPTKFKIQYGQIYRVICKQF